MEGRNVFVYVTSPIMQLRGGFRVGEVWTGTPQDIWDKVSEWAGVEKDDFDAYYAGQSIAYALEITEVWEYANPPGLSTLRSRFDNFIVPQSWRYVKPEEHQSFRMMERAMETGNCDRKSDSTSREQASELPPVLT
jgi:predicted transcriptional regulator